MKSCFRSFWLWSIAAVALLSSSGCATRTAPPQVAVAEIAPPAAPTPPPPEPVTRKAAPVQDPGSFPWMTTSEFFPPGSNRIVPSPYIPPPMVDTPRAWFPSTDECTSPNGDWTLIHDGRRRPDGIDYLISARRGNAVASSPMFQARYTLEMLWSPDSKHAAVTVMTGSNRSIVLIARIPDRHLSDPVAVADVLKEHLPPVLMSAPQFIMALRWTSTHRLVLRGRGQQEIEPFTVFGYEVEVDPERLSTPFGVRFLRAYTRTIADSAPRPVTTGPAAAP